MKKYLRRIGALLMTVVMIVSMCTITFASGTTSNEYATIKGIEPENGIQVKAYKIVDYDTAGEYKAVLDGTIDDVSKITGDDVWKLYGRVAELTTHVDISKKDKGNSQDYIANVDDGLTPGVWMIVVTGSSKYLYNPAILSVMQEAKGYKYGTLDYDTDTWNSTIYVKRAEPKITKTAVNEDNTDKVNGVQYGDILKFTIISDVPGYADGKSNIQYVISDKLDGLKLVNDEGHKPSVEIRKADDPDAGEKEVTDKLKESVSKAIENNKDSFSVDLSGNEWDTWIQENRGNKIIITYYAKVTSTKKINVDKTTNSATLQYSTNDGIQTKSADTKHYTFGIDTGIKTSTTTTIKDKTGEFIKVDENGKVKYVEKTISGQVEIKEGKALSGAEFELYVGGSDQKSEKLFKDASGHEKFTTDENGKLEINGLDSDITYWLVETKAPTGFKINSTPIKVNISAEYDDKGTLNGYTVNIGNGDNIAVSHYEYNEKDGTTTLKEESNPFGFKNTKLSELPSTGGIGTYIFTVVGVMIMAGVAGMFIISRRKER